METTKFVKQTKPLGRKAYGTIPHLLGSKRGPADLGCNEGQHRICTERSRPHDRVIVQEKLDGTNVAVAKVGGAIVPINRAGYPCDSAPQEQHRLFAAWVFERQDLFDSLLTEGERLCGEWLALAHGTLYDLAGREPFVPFDIMAGETRVPLDEFHARVGGILPVPRVLHDGGPLPTDRAVELLGERGFYGATTLTEGVVYRVESRKRKTDPLRVDFLAKFVRHEFAPGRYLCGLECSAGDRATWNWRPSR